MEVFFEVRNIERKSSLWIKRNFLNLRKKNSPTFHKLDKTGWSMCSIHERRREQCAFNKQLVLGATIRTRKSPVLHISKLKALWLFETRDSAWFKGTMRTRARSLSNRRIINQQEQQKLPSTVFFYFSLQENAKANGVRRLKSLS